MIDVSGGKNSIKNSVAIMSAGDVFVINLCASMTPMPSVPKSLKGYEEHRLYQVARIEDGRHRYRLRLGFFNTEADAELAVASLRSLYPAAFTSRAGSEDMRYAGDPLLTGRFTARAPSAAATEVKPAVTTAVADSTPKSVAPPAQKPAATAPVAQQTAAPKPQVAKPAAPVAAKPAPQPSIELTAQSLLDVEIPATKERSTPFTMTTHQPFHVARGVEIPDTDLELAPTIIPGMAKKKEPEAQKQTAAPKAAAPVQHGANHKAASPSLPVPKAPAAKVSPPMQVSKSMAALANSAATKKAAAPAPAPAKPAVAPVAKPAPTPAAATAPVPATSRPAAAPKNTDDYVPILDTTMTIRTITLAEIEDENQQKWFSVQLAVSEQPFNLDAMPKLDIFAAYRVYSVAINSEDAKLKHSLRLGFFKEEVSADAVAGYLKTFFPAPTITRIGIAEYERFLEPKVAAPAEPESKVVNLNDKREAGTAPSKPTFGVNPSPTPVRPKATPAKNAAAKHETTQPGLRRGPTGKYSVEAMKKNHANTAADSGVRKNMQRPQSFLSKLIGRELD